MKTTLATTAPVEQALSEAASPEFDYARKLQTNVRLHLMAASGFMVLMGIELKRLKKNLGETRGRKTRNASGISWGDLVKQELGFTDDTATKYIAMAEGSKQRVSILQELEQKLLAAPLTDLTAQEQEQVFTAVKNITDGKTAKELMQEYGIARQDAGANLDKDRNKGGNSTRSVETPEQQAQGWFGSVAETMIGLRSSDQTKFHTLVYSLPLSRDPEQELTGHVSIEDLEEELTHWLTVVQDAKARLTKAMHASKTKDAKAREEEARKGILNDLALDAAVKAIAETEQYDTEAEAVEAAHMHGKEPLQIVRFNRSGRYHLLVTQEERDAANLLYGPNATEVIHDGPGKQAGSKLPHILTAKKKGAKK